MRLGDGHLVTHPTLCLVWSFIPDKQRSKTSIWSTMLPLAVRYLFQAWLPQQLEQFWARKWENHLGLTQASGIRPVVISLISCQRQERLCLESIGPFAKSKNTQ